MSPVRNELEFPGLSPAASLATGNPAQSGCAEVAASSKEPVPRDPPEPSSTKPRAEGNPRPHRRTQPPPPSAGVVLQLRGCGRPAWRSAKARGLRQAPLTQSRPAPVCQSPIDKRPHGGISRRQPIRDSHDVSYARKPRRTASADGSTHGLSRSFRGPVGRGGGGGGGGRGRRRDGSAAKPCGTAAAPPAAGRIDGPADCSGAPLAFPAAP